MLEALPAIIDMRTSTEYIGVTLFLQPFPINSAIPGTNKKVVFMITEIPREDDRPPSGYLELVARSCPKAMYLYLQLWKKRDCFNHVKIDKDAIAKEFLLHHIKFDSDMRALCKEQLLSYTERKKTIVVELVGYDDIGNNEVDS